MMLSHPKCKMPVNGEMSTGSFVYAFMAMLFYLCMLIFTFCPYIKRNDWRRQFFLLSFLLKPEVFLLPLSLSFRYKILKNLAFLPQKIDSSPSYEIFLYLPCLFFQMNHCMFLRSTTLRGIHHQPDVHCYSLLSCGHLPAHCFQLCKQGLQLNPLPDTRWVLRRTSSSFCLFIYLFVWLRLTRVRSIYINTRTLLGSETTTA